MGVSVGSAEGGWVGSSVIVGKGVGKGEGRGVGTIGLGVGGKD